MAFSSLESMREIKKAVTGHQRPGMSNVTLKVVATGGVGLSSQAVWDLVVCSGPLSGQVVACVLPSDY